MSNYIAEPPYRPYYGRHDEATDTGIIVDATSKRANTAVVCVFQNDELACTWVDREEAPAVIKAIEQATGLTEEGA